MKVNETFYSLEGEGTWQGYPTIFIRLSGCNLTCKWCDTTHKTHKNLDIHQIMDSVKSWHCNRVKITGGEPLIHDSKLPLLVKVLKDNGFLVAIETNGTLYDFTVFNRADLICMDIKTPSSGMESDMAVVSKTWSQFSDKMELKLVISDEQDLEFAEKYLLFMDKLILMPNSQKDIDKELIHAMKQNFPNARYGLRLQEILEVR